jgi:LPS export ABC transporter protein LptC
MSLMGRTVRIILASFIAASIAGLAVMVFAIYKSRDAYKVTFIADDSPGVRVERMVYRGTRHGRIEWELEAASAERMSGSGLMTLNTVKLVFHGRGERGGQGPSYTLRAMKGGFDSATGDIDATGRVTLDAGDGARLATERMRYAAATGLLTSDAAVDLIAGPMHAIGAGLSLDVHEGSLMLLGGVKAVFKDPAMAGGG